MQRVFRVVETRDLKPAGARVTSAFIRSVRRYGILNPMLLAEVIDADGVISLEIIDGNRRVRAAQSARLPRVPAVVLKATTPQDRARLTLLCNYMRSSNFHTESGAILALAADEEGAAEAARTIGLGRMKMQQLYRKIARMPEPVRRAMDEHRIPVTAATWVGAWPEGLQRELIELLGRRRTITTTMMKDLRAWYAERHPEEFDTAEPAKEDIPFDEWNGTSLHVVEIPEPPIAVHLSGERREDHVEGRHADSQFERAPHRAVVDAPVVATETLRPVAPDQEGGATPVEPDLEPFTQEVGDVQPAEAHGAVPRAVPESRLPSPPMHVTRGQGLDRSSRAEDRMVSTRSDDSPVNPDSRPTHRPAHGAGRSGAASSPAGIDSTLSDPRDAKGEDKMAFVLRLDATLRELARDGHALGIDRSVWVDRAMRAWDRIDT